MKKLIAFLGFAALGVAGYLVLNPPRATDPADDVDQFGRRVGRWGTKQRVSGAGNSVAGGLKQTVGDLAGSDELSNAGAFDQAKGAVQDTVGQAAHAVEDTIHDLNR